VISVGGWLGVGVSGKGWRPREDRRKEGVRGRVMGVVMVVVGGGVGRGEGIGVERAGSRECRLPVYDVIQIIPKLGKSMSSSSSQVVYMAQVGEESGCSCGFQSGILSWYLESYLCTTPTLCNQKMQSL